MFLLLPKDQTFIFYCLVVLSINNCAVFVFTETKYKLQFYRNQIQAAILLSFLKIFRKCQCLMSGLQFLFVTDCFKNSLPTHSLPTHGMNFIQACLMVCRIQHIKKNQNLIGKTKVPLVLYYDMLPFSINQS